MLDKLLDPHAGLMIWTVISFLVLVLLMKKFAWNAILGAVEARESRLREEREAAEKARREAERIQGEVESRLANASEEAKSLLAQAGKDGEAMRGKLKADAEGEAKVLVEKTRAQLEEERRRLVGELRSEVASLSLMAAERIMRKSVDKSVSKDALDQFFGELEKKGN